MKNRKKIAIAGPKYEAGCSWRPPAAVSASVTTGGALVARATSASACDAGAPAASALRTASCDPSTRAAKAPAMSTATCPPIRSARLRMTLMAAGSPAVTEPEKPGGITNAAARSCFVSDAASAADRTVRILTARRSCGVRKMAVNERATGPWSPS